MATITYIKLGPIGDAFASKELGLYLNSNNASEIDKSILNTRLSSFLLTGFVVEISKLEYDNIKLLYSITTNIPLNNPPVGQPYILEPVEDIVSTPLANIIGKRYLIINPTPGTFLGFKDHIAVSDGIGWNYTKPENGFILPVYKSGISVHYTGTYPSGSWDIPDDITTALAGGTSTGTNSDTILYFTDLLNTEAQQRKDADKALQDQINALPSSTPFSGKAADVTVQDTANLIAANNVENALKELVLKINTNTISISGILTTLTSILASGVGFQFLYGTVSPTDADGSWNCIYLDTAHAILYKKEGVTADVSAWVEIYRFTISPKVDFWDTGTLITDMVIDFTVVPYNTLGTQPTIILREGIGGFKWKPRTDIYYELTYDDADYTNLLSLKLVPDGDTDGKTTEPIQLILKK